MRRNAGSFVRNRMVRLSLYDMAGVGVVMGLGIGMLFYALFPLWIGFGWGIVAYMATAATMLIAFRVLDRPSSQWNLENLRKGTDAETYVGQIIEYAITADGCAVAHSVTEIAEVGDMDHVVATPKGMWVIETKYKRVPKKYFREVLNRIAANTDAVRQWAPATTPVRGCLVLAYESGIKRRKYSSGEEKIAVYTRDSLADLMRELRKDARGKRSVDERIAKDIWKLGHIAE